MNILYDGRPSYNMENKKRKRHIGDYVCLLVDIEKAREVVRRATLETWWYWSGGSALIFWRWNPSYLKEARDGTPVFVKDTLPRYTKR